MLTRFRRLSFLSLFLFLFLHLFSFSVQAANIVGLTPGEFRVDESGAATYNIPINTPAGRAGVTPRVALSYSSNNMSEGPVGVGWSVSGLSSITRCPQTPIYDAGNISAVSYTSADKFCLGGQRLILKSGIYGEPNSTYRTEIDNFSVITARLGSTTDGPKYFEVTNKSGETHYFGDSTTVSPQFANHSDAFVEPGGYAAGVLARSWMLKITKDRKDNYIEYNYAKDTAEGSLYIDNIKYSGNLNTGAATFAEIDFVYRNYKKGFKGFMAGAPIFHDQLLSRIDTKIDGSIYRSYFLWYENSNFIEERTLLRSVQECNDSLRTTCFPRTWFNWQRPALASSGQEYVCETEPGTTDFCYWEATTTNYRLFPTIDTSLATGTANRDTTQVFDINGDGYHDLIYVSGSYWYVKLGPNFGNPTTLSSVGDTKKEYAMSMDYNGDGIRDLLVADSASSNWHAVYYEPVEYNFDFCIPGLPCNTGSTSTSIPTKKVQNLGIPATGLEGGAQVMDVNGDGMEDIVFSSGHYIRAHLNNGDGTFTANHNLANLGSSTSSIEFTSGSTSQTADMKSTSAIDINGDGRSDLITKVTTTTTTGGCYVNGRLARFVTNSVECRIDRNGVWQTSTSTRSSYRLYKSSGPVTAPTLSLVQTLDSSSSLSNLRIADLNGDGLSDLLSAGASSWYYRLSNGKQLLAARDTGLATTATTKHLDQFVDLNGDGRADVLLATSTSNWSVYFSRPTLNAEWAHFERRGSRNFDNNATVRFGDTNGDGKMDMLTAVNGTWKEYTNRKNIKEYVIDTITDGNGVASRISYLPMTNGSVYAHQASDYNINSDTISPVSGMQLVHQVSIDSNVGSPPVTNTYQYGGMLIHKKGRGSLGFQMLRSIDHNGVITETHYNQSYDAANFAKAGMPVYSEQRFNDQLLSTATNTLDVQTTSQGSVFPYISVADEASYIYGSNDISTKVNNTVTTNEYDGWGNLTDSTSIVTDSATLKTMETITANTYGTTAIEQQYGRLTNTTVQKKRTGDTAYTTRDTVFTYNSDLLLETNIVSPSVAKTKLTTTNAYDAYGNKTTVSVTGYSTETGSPQTRTKSNNYDSRGRYLNYKQNALGERITFKYNGLTAATASGITTNITETDINNISTTTYVNNLGQVIKIDHPDSRLTITTNSFCVNCVTNSYYKTRTTVTGSPTQEVFFDRWNREVGSQVQGFDGTWKLTKTSYDAEGRQSKTYEPGSTAYYTQSFYDGLGRVNKITKPNGGIVTNQVYGLESRTTNELNQVYKTFRNGFGETAYTLNALGNRVTFTYNAYGKVLESKTTVSGKNSIITSEYDEWGRKTQTDDPVKGIWIYKYNAFGELYSQKTHRGHTFINTYDLLGRKVRSHEANEGTLCWNYGSTAHVSSKAAGQVLSTAKYDGANVACNTTATATIKKSFTYTGLGLPKIVTTSMSTGTYTQSQSYDIYSRPLVTTYPAGTSSFAVKNIYNSYGYIKEQRNNATNALYKRIDSMTDRGQIEKFTLGNGVITNQNYRDDNGWLSSIDVTKGTSTWLNGIGVTYDAMGNVKTRTSDYDASGLSGSHYTETYNYDDLNRLEERTIAVASGGTSLPADFLPTQTYNFDNWGNFTFKTGAGYYKYDLSEVHKLLGVYSNADFTGERYEFTYDKNGNITFDGTRTFEYGSIDKPTLISKPGASSIMSYGVSQELYYKVDTYLEGSANVTYKTTSLGSYEKVVRTGGKGSLTEHKYYVGDTIVTQRSDNTNDTFYLHKDHQGSVVATTNKSGAVISQAIYDPFGKRSSVYLDSVFDNYTYAEPTDRGYTGHKHIASLDIIHMGGRIYDPTLGRFLQADPNIQSPSDSLNYNRYSYVQNNPMTMTDPSGYFILWFKGVRRAIKKHWRTIVSIVVAIYMPGMNFMAGWHTAAQGALTGFVAGGVATGSLRGALVGALTGAAFGGLHGSKSDFMGILSHGVVGGTSSVLSGGKFGTGFFTAGFTKSLGDTGFYNESSLDKLITTSERIENAVKAAIVGGSVSELTGGKFANGAITGTFSRLLNDDAIDQQIKEQRYLRALEERTVTVKVLTVREGQDHSGIWLSDDGNGNGQILLNPNGSYKGVFKTKEGTYARYKESEALGYMNAEQKYLGEHASIDDYINTYNGKVDVVEFTITSSAARNITSNYRNTLGFSCATNVGGLIQHIPRFSDFSSWRVTPGAVHRGITKAVEQDGP